MPQTLVSDRTANALKCLNSDFSSIRNSIIICLFTFLSILDPVINCTKLYEIINY